ncbi:hypothetical protein AAEX28_11335 [Lentisphaerota bacterium WC36G]|nr:hypothetical protein LJT99_14170 [Lentisphaerae bacterium WC36]
MTTKEVEKLVLKKVQGGIKVEPHPFLPIAQECGTDEETVVEIINSMKDSGNIRRFGAVFDSHALGYSSTLCAANIDENNADEIAKIKVFFSTDPRITHAYIRKGMPNLWFTITELNEKFAETVAFYDKLFVGGIWNMPAIKRYKIRAVFDDNNDDVGSTELIKKTSFSEAQKNAIRYFQGDIEVTSNLFANAAQHLNIELAQLMQWLQRWQYSKVMRRLSAVVFHRKIGVKGNAMCAWEVAKDRVDEVGEYLAKLPVVTHCYERDVPVEFKYNMFAMMHGNTLDDVAKNFAIISSELDLPNGKMFDSVLELEKSSPKYFI